MEFVKAGLGRALCGINRRSVRGKEVEVPTATTISF
jgi:hypothetical protein